MTPLIQRLSYSSIAGYLACPYRWALSQVRRIVRPTSEAAFFGSAVHAAVERFIAGTTQGQSPDPAALWQGAFDEQVARAARGAGVDWQRDREAVLAEGLALLTCSGPIQVDYDTVDAPLRQVEFPDMPSWLATIRVAVEAGRPAIEQFVRMEIDGIDVPFVGFVDWVEADGVAADLKTTTWPWSAEAAALELQPTYYLAALAAPGRFRHYVLVRGDSPRVQVFETERTAADIAWACDLARGVWRAIQAELFHPNPTYRWCGPRYCEYWEDCRGAVC
jgi:RecB family exonuclease